MLPPGPGVRLSSSAFASSTRVATSRRCSPAQSQNALPYAVSAFAGLISDASRELKAVAHERQSRPGRLKPGLHTRARQSSSITDHGSLVTDNSLRSNALKAAFSLIEIMVAMVLLSFIVIGLLAMFHQVQKAFRSSMTQVDILESGRSITDLIARDLEQTIASSLASSNAVNFQQPNFYAVVSPDFANSLHQTLPGNIPARTNVVQTIFFVSKANQDWIGTGYQVRPDYANAGIGTLYRYSTNVSKARAINLFNMFASALPPVGVPATNLSRVADGVIDFRVRAFDTNGVEITTTNTAPFTHLAFPAMVNGSQRLVTITNSYGSWDSTNGQYNYYFVSNAVPASVELEIAFLESHLLDRYRSISAGITSAPPQGIQDAQRSYLSNHVANVHIFRQRIPIRNVDPSAYQ